MSIRIKSTVEDTIFLTESFISLIRMMRYCTLCWFPTSSNNNSYGCLGIVLWLQYYGSNKKKKKKTEKKATLTTQECRVLSSTNPRSSTWKNNICWTTYLSSHKSSCSARWGGRIRWSCLGKMLAVGSDPKCFETGIWWLSNLWPNS